MTYLKGFGATAIEYGNPGAGLRLQVPPAKASKRRRGRVYAARAGIMGLGDTYSDSTPCSMIPVGDPYRKPGNYCTQPSGNVIEFNANGSVDADPFAPGASSSSSSSGGGITDAIAKIAGGLLSSFTSQPPTAMVAQPTGMSTTTKIALAGGAVLVFALIAKRNG